MSYRTRTCTWCGTPFPEEADPAYGLIYFVTDDGYRVCSAQCENAWYSAGNMENVKKLMKNEEEAADIIITLLNDIDKLTEDKNPEWILPSLATARVWLSRPKS